MICRPNPGQQVRLVYRRSLRQGGLALPAPPHGATGRVLAAGAGPGPINALVELETGGRVVVPRGNLEAR